MCRTLTGNERRMTRGLREWNKQVCRQRDLSSCCSSLPTHTQTKERCTCTRRREVLKGTSSVLAVWISSSLSKINEKKALAIPLAPLGKTKKYGDKATGKSIEEVKSILKDSLEVGQYFVNSAGLPREVFKDDCRFKDPTNDVKGLSRYLKALDLLFDKDQSEVQLLSIEVISANQIQAKYTLGGTLKFIWKPCVQTYSGVVTYTLSDDDGLIETQEQTWSITAQEALRETFSPCRDTTT